MFKEYLFTMCPALLSSLGMQLTSCKYSLYPHGQFVLMEEIDHNITDGCEVLNAKHMACHPPTCATHMPYLCSITQTDPRNQFLGILKKGISGITRK